MPKLFRHCSQGSCSPLVGTTLTTTKSIAIRGDIDSRSRHNASIRPIASGRSETTSTPGSVDSAVAAVGSDCVTAGTGTGVLTALAAAFDATICPRAVSNGRTNRSRLTADIKTGR